MRKLFKERKLFKGGNYMRKYGIWYYLSSPIIEKKNVSCFDIGEVPRSPGKRNWNWLYFLPFIFTFKQGD